MAQKRLRAFLSHFFTAGGRDRKLHFAFMTFFCENAFGALRVCVAMKAPVGLLSGGAVCVSRWRGFAPTSSAERDKREIKIIIPLKISRA